MQFSGILKDSTATFEKWALPFFSPSLQTFFLQIHRKIFAVLKHSTMTKRPHFIPQDSECSHKHTSLPTKDLRVLSG